MDNNGLNQDKEPENKEKSDNGGSAETTDKRTNVSDNKNVSRETIMSGTNLKYMYRMFRKGGMNRRESMFNAVYLVCQNKYDGSDTVVREKYKNVHRHPISWAADKAKVHKHNKWSAVMQILKCVASVSHFFSNIKRSAGKALKKINSIPKSMDNSLRAIKAFLRVLCKSLLPAGAVLLVIYTGAVITKGVSQDYTIGVYVDGVYQGNTDDADSVYIAKYNYESTLTDRYGSPIVLECDITFSPQVKDNTTYFKTANYVIFEEYLKSFTQSGYGLYIDNVLAAVTDSEMILDATVDEYMSAQREKYESENYGKSGTQKFVYGNYLTVKSADYPKSYFLTESELRQLFDLPEKDSAGTYSDADLKFIKKDNLRTTGDGFSYSISLDYSKLSRYDVQALGTVNSAAPNSVTVDIAVSKDEVERIEIPYTEEYVYDSKMPEGMRRLITAGKTGEKLIYYKAVYRGDKLISREVAGEEITKQATNKVVRIGTKALSEEEKALIPTGTYIYPYNGIQTSDYGWRVLGGQNNFHQGLDISGPRGGSVVASDGGEVIEVGYTNGYGKYCKIRHNEDTVTRYAHCDDIYVEEGDLVGQGDIIATLGDTGYATGVHVHFEIIINGETVDPLPYMTGDALPVWNG